MMKKYMVAIGAIVIASLFLVHPASAHVLQTDGDLGAVLHILPDDSPSANQPTTYELAFSGEKGFALNGCDCIVSYVLNGNTVGTAKLEAKDGATSSNTFTFPKPGVYTISVAGMPKPGYQFTSFTLSYPVRVKANSQLTTQPFPVSLGIAFGLLTILLLLVAAKADGMMSNRNETDG